MRSIENYTFEISRRSETVYFTYLIGGFFSSCVCLWDGGWEEGEIPAGTIRGEAIIHEEDVGL